MRRVVDAGREEVIDGPVPVPDGDFELELQATRPKAATSRTAAAYRAIPVVGDFMRRRIVHDYYGKVSEP
jgi:hypothetical protein